MLDLILSGDRAFIQDVLVVLICGAALIWGSGPERAVALTWLVLFEGTSWLYETVSGDGMQVLQVDVVAAVTDVAVGIVFIGIALYANRNYTLLIAGMQVLAMTAHLARGLSEVIAPIAYLTMIYAPGWLQLIFLGIGLARHIQRKRKYGPYRDWRIVRNPPAILVLLGGSRVASNSVRADDRTSSWRDELK
ncbi:MAG: hypothetical protein ACX930_10420 [Erythrobacter sp.]